MRLKVFQAPKYLLKGAALAGALSVSALAAGGVLAKDLQKLSEMESQISASHTAAKKSSQADTLIDVVFSQLRPQPAIQFVSTPNEALPKAQVKLTDLRLVLAQLSFSGGANNTLSVVRAQGVKAQKALIIQGGSITLNELIKIIESDYPGMPILADEAFTLPIAIWTDGQLVLESGDNLNLSQSNGAFIANFGGIHAESASIASHGAANAYEKEFRPFVASAGSGYATFDDVDFKDLGFGKTAAFSGVSFLNGGIYPAHDRTVIHNSRFENTGSLTLKGTQGAVVSGNQFASSPITPLSLRGAKDTSITTNAFLGTASGSALKIFEGATGTIVRGNVFLEAAQNGIEINGASHSTEVTNNLLWANQQAGISVDQSDCIFLKNNLVFKNKTKGVLLRTSRGSQIVGNDFFANKRDGLHVSRQPAETLAIIEHNSFVANRTGLNSSSAATLAMHGNNFSHQFPMLVAGDITDQSKLIFADLTGASDATLTSGSVDLFGISPMTCALTSEKES